jgi:predicted transcriptional regulator
MFRAMEVPSTPVQEAQLDQIARTSGCGADQLARNVLGQFLEREASFRAAVLLGREQIERGEGVEHAEVQELEAIADYAPKINQMLP